MIRKGMKVTWVIAFDDFTKHGTVISDVDPMEGVLVAVGVLHENGNPVIYIQASQLKAAE